MLFQRSIFFVCLIVSTTSTKECHNTCLQQFQSCSVPKTTIESKLNCARTSTICRSRCRTTEPVSTQQSTSISTWKPKQNGLPILPFGFYQYTITSERDQQLPTNEITQGMNLVAPYASTASPDDKWYQDMEAFMDRCADIGFMVHFQLIGFEKLNNTVEVLHNLTQQINHFKNHSALFGWYLADEPDGQGIPPSLLQPKYDLIKKLDSNHPVSMVFCAGGAKHFLNSLDLIMVDIYPIPNQPARSVANGLAAVRALGKPIMFVPQSFGGGENWAREPSLREERLMTYISLLYDVVAIQYFVRSGPIVFPYSASSWSEIRKIAAEVLALTSAIAFEGSRIPNVTQTSIAHIDAGAWRDRDGSIVVLAVNMGTGKGAAIDAATFILTLPNTKNVTSIVSMFEDNSEIPIQYNKNGDVVLSDYLRGGNTRAYRIVTTSTKISKLQYSSETNLVYNPSYEISFNPAVPDGNYVDLHSLTDDSATFFADARDSIDGRQSLRLTSPSAGAGLSFAPYTIPKLNQTAKSYSFTVWIKGVKNGQEVVTFRFNDKILNPKDGSSSTINITATSNWQQTEIIMNVGSDIATACPYGCRGWMSYELITKGTVWLDALSLVENK